jgi:hypothetical protein
MKKPRPLSVAWRQPGRLVTCVFWGSINVTARHSVTLHLAALGAPTLTYFMVAGSAISGPFDEPVAIDKFADFEQIFGNQVTVRTGSAPSSRQ